MQNEKFRHRIPMTWYDINQDNQFTISGKITKIINRVNKAKDQVNIELAVEQGEKTIRSEIKKIH